MKERRRISPEERAEMEEAYEMCMEMLRRGEERERKLMEERKAARNKNAANSQN